MINILKKNILVTLILSFAVYVFFSVYFHFINNIFFIQNIDSAGYVNLVTNVSNGNGMVSSIFNSYYSLLPTLTMSGDDYCTYDMGEAYSEQSFFRWHAHLITYLIAIFVKIGFPSLSVVISINTIGLIGAMFVPIIYLKYKKVPLIIILGFFLCLFFWIPLSEAIFGQLYIEKIYPLLMVSIILLSYEYLNNEKLKKNILKYIVILTFIAILISERASMMTGMFFMSYTILFSGIKFYKNRKAKNLFFLGIVGFGWYLIYTIFFYDSPYASSFDISNIKNNLKAIFDYGSNYNLLVIKLLIVVFPMLIISAFGRQILIIAIFSLIPNLILNIGGALKTGFTSHYHMMYIPFLISAATISILELNHYIKVYFGSDHKKKLISSSLLLIVLLGFTFFNMKYEPYNLKPISFNFDKQSYLYDVITKDINYDRKLKDINLSEFLKTENSNDIKISSSSWLMPFLSDIENVKVNSFPIGIYDSDFILLPMKIDSENIDLPSYLSPDLDKEQKQECIKDYLKLNYKLEFKSKETTPKIYLYKRIE